MKKYLIKGALALFSGGLLFSCAEKESEYVPLAQQKTKAFEDVFKEVYGDNIDPYQDWGFSQGKVNYEDLQIVDAVDLRGGVAYTRTAAFGHSGAVLAFQPRTREGEGTTTPVASWEAGANTQHNLWGDPDYHNLKVPPALTDGQKIRVMAYFQANPYLSYVDPGYTKFFVQQVYKGGTSPGAFSSEQYTQTNGTPLIGSNNMDWLYVGKEVNGQIVYDHVNDFNNGDYNNGNTTKVLNNGACTNDYDTDSHPDQITLMINSGTKFVAFGSSTGSSYHTDCCALAGWDVIEAWAIAHRDSLERIGKFGATLDDGWNRSFVGLDYENRTIDGLYTNPMRVAKALDFRNGGFDYVKYHNNVVPVSSFQDFNLAYPDGTPVYYVISGVSNQAIADYIKYTKSDGSLDNVTKDQVNLYMTQAEFAAYGITIQNQRAGYYDLDKLLGYVHDSAHPTETNGNWVKNIGGRDYYFCDWIVTLTSADPAPQPHDEYYITNEDVWSVYDQGRVFCEDLGRAAREDLDYNDIVFDARAFRHFRHHRMITVKYRENPAVNPNAQVLRRDTTVYIEPTTNYYLNIKLLAAGGTIPVSLYVGEKEYVIHDQFNSPESTPTEMMVNTRDNNSTAYGSFGTRDPVQLGDIHEQFRVQYSLDPNDYEDFDVMLIQMPDSLSAKIGNIRLWSCFGGGRDVTELESVKGGCPQKFMAPIGTRWASERNNISLAYPGLKDNSGKIINPGFNDWVENRDNVPWAYYDIDYCYQEEHPYDPNGRNLPLAFRCSTTIRTEGETQLWSGGASYGSNWNLRNVELNLDVDRFTAGDRLRFYATDIPIPQNGEEFTNDDEKAWITVVVGNITPYFINTEFPYFIYENDVKVFKTSGCIEVVIDQAAAETLNNYLSRNDNKLKFEVQGRNFTLTRICKVVD